MPILLIPLLLLVLLAALVVVVPLSLHLRYRQGRARRRVLGWVVRLNAWGLLSSVPLFLVVAWLGARWSVDAPRDAAVGLLCGGILGLVGLRLTRFEQVQGRLHYTPNRWLVLLLTILLALRIVLGIWLAWHRLNDAGVEGQAWMRLVDAGGLWSVAGVLLGYATAYAWGLSRR